MLIASAQISGSPGVSHSSGSIFPIPATHQHFPWDNARGFAEGMEGVGKISPILSMWLQ